MTSIELQRDFVGGANAATLHHYADVRQTMMRRIQESDWKVGKRYLSEDAVSSITRFEDQKRAASAAAPNLPAQVDHGQIRSGNLRH